MIDAILILVFAGLLYLMFNGKPSNFPPGPRGLPIIGNLHQLGAEPHKTFTKMKNKYGDIFSLKFASYNVVVLNNPKDIRDAFADPNFSGRADFPAILDSSGGSLRGVTLNFGKSWVEQREFTVKTLRDFGFGKKSVEEVVHEEVQELIQNLKQDARQPTKITHKFNAAVFNVLWIMITATRHSHDDPTLKELMDLLAFSAKEDTFEKLIVFFPWLYNLRKKLQFLFPSSKTKKNIEYLMKLMREHQRTFKIDSPRDFIDVYLKEIKQTTDPASSFYKSEGLRNLSYTVRDMCIAGSKTTATTLSWTCLLLAMHPDTQEKLHEEIIKVVGTSRLPSLSDRSLMPYTEAVIMEVMRFSSLVPLAGWHATTKDVKFRGYDLSKGTLVIPNLYGCMHDPEIWEEPESFLPKRFLAADKNSVVKHDAYMPFSIGKRICLGITLAQDELFLFVSSLFQRFRVGQDPNGKRLTMDCHIGSVRMPKDFEVVLHDRIEP